jgi:hypothetical protein
VGSSQILSPASSSFTEEHASSSGPQWRATFPAVFRHQCNWSTPRALAWPSQLQSIRPATPFMLHLKNQPFRAWQYIYVGVFSHTDTQNPTSTSRDEDLLCSGQLAVFRWYTVWIETRSLLGLAVHRISSVRSHCKDSCLMYWTTNSLTTSPYSKPHWSIPGPDILFSWGTAYYYACTSFIILRFLTGNSPLPWVYISLSTYAIFKHVMEVMLCTSCNCASIASIVSEWWETENWQGAKLGK